MNHIMLDLETWGVKPGCAVVSIGAVRVRLGDLGDAIEEIPSDLMAQAKHIESADEFYCTIDLRTAVQAGLHLDADTALWWLRQADAAKVEVLMGGLVLADALERFQRWLPSGPLRVWGNGASFDAPILAVAFEAAGLRRPWDGRDQLCYRTLRAAYAHVPYEKPALAHHALHDARAQARHLERIAGAFGAFKEGKV